eukprot:12928918-Ditylum_brightwellii.AAC.1
MDPKARFDHSHSHQQEKESSDDQMYLSSDALQSVGLSSTWMSFFPLMQMTLFESYFAGHVYIVGNVWDPTCLWCPWAQCAH